MPTEEHGRVIGRGRWKQAAIARLHLCSDEPSIALRPGLKHDIAGENDGLRGVEIVNEIGDQAVIANNEPGGGEAGSGGGESIDQLPTVAQKARFPPGSPRFDPIGLLLFGSGFQPCLCEVSEEERMEPTVRIELTTRALRKRCSTN